MNQYVILAIQFIGICILIWIAFDKGWNAGWDASADDIRDQLIKRGYSELMAEIEEDMND